MNQVRKDILELLINLRKQKTSLYDLRRETHLRPIVSNHGNIMQFCVQAGDTVCVSQIVSLISTASLFVKNRQGIELELDSEVDEDGSTVVYVTAVYPVKETDDAYRSRLLDVSSFTAVWNKQLNARARIKEILGVEPSVQQVKELVELFK
jgi:hypothetical protein